jgi:hypothetical protein
VAALLVIAGCYAGGAYGPMAAACPQLTGSADPLSARFSANARADVKIRAFVAAAKDLTDLSLQAEATAADACRRMGRDLDIPEADLSTDSQDPGGSARAACGALAARIDGILRQGVQIQATVRPPECQADAQVRAQCEGVCAVELDPGEIVAQCEPGKLSGHCRGECQGRCDGTCRGQCEGECAARDASGACAGQCEGTCRGQCDATCHARCEGEWQAPRCEGHVRPPSADAECEASCRARAEFRAQCTPAEVTVQTNEAVQDAARLAATLRANLPALLQAQIALGARIADSARTVVQVGTELPRVVGDAGAQALACVAAASSTSVKASARIDVTVRASANVSGKVGAG